MADEQPAAEPVTDVANHQGDDLHDSLALVVERLLSAAKTDPELRASLRRCARHILEQTDDPATDNSSAGTSALEHPLATAFDFDPAEITSPPREYERRFFTTPPRADAASDVPPATVEHDEPRPSNGHPTPARRDERPPVRDEDLPLIAQRCRLKVEAAGWAAKGGTRLSGDDGGEGADWEQYRQLVDRAKTLPDCHLLPCSPACPPTTDPRDWMCLAECFDTLATAVELAQAIFACGDDDHDLCQPAVELLAEAQSMVRVANASAGGRDDADQCKVHRWLEHITSQHRFYIRRYMKVDDAADPVERADLRRRIEQLHARWAERDGRRRQRRQGLRRITYHLGLLEHNPVDPAHDRAVIASTIHELIETGMPPSDVELRELLLPRLDELPDWEQLPQGARQVLTEIDRYLASRPSDDPDTGPGEPTPEVEQVRRLLAGRAVVMIGGKRRSRSQRNLEQAFGLSELLWEDTAPHQPLSDFEPAIVRPDVALVLMAIRWRSHSYGQLKTVCDREGKPLVRLPAGYGVNRVAAEILAQCSEQLKAGETV